MASHTLYLVRHGRAAAGFDAHRDPPLDELGVQQAAELAESLAKRLEPRRLVSSPILRARQTAEPLAARWGVEASIVPAISEIPSPTEDLTARASWLREAMQGTWTALPPAQQQFRQALVSYLTSTTEDQVLFSHFVAINLAVGAATSDERMVIFRPDNASVTELRVEDGQLFLESLGSEAETKVN